MKKNELKEILKPLIKQCIKEVIFEEGVLSGIITEVVGGLTMPQPQPIVESRAKVEERKEIVRNKSLKETKQKLFAAISKDAYNGVNVFESTEPLSKGGSVGDATAPSSPLSSYAPGDPGVNIDGLLSVAGKSWTRLL
jgi:hypothetical protein